MQVFIYLDLLFVHFIHCLAPSNLPSDPPPLSISLSLSLTLQRVVNTCFPGIDNIPTLNISTIYIRLGRLIMYYQYLIFFS